jgi:hypothetical protein
MANRRASIWMYVKVGDRWRYVKPVVGKNNKLRPGYALIAGVETHVPNPAYYLRYREGSRVIWRKCSSAADATIARERQEAYLTAFAHGLTPKQQWDKTPPPAMMNDVLLNASTICGVTSLASLDAARSGPAYQIVSVDVSGFKPMFVFPD